MNEQQKMNKIRYLYKLLIIAIKTLESTQKNDLVNYKINFAKQERISPMLPYLLPNKGARSVY